jgi:hypothetical protein
MADWPTRPKRSSVFIDAALDHAAQREPMQLVRIRDLSEGGAKIEGKAPPVGAHVILSRGVLEFPARVVWASGRFFGIAFDTPADIDQVMRATGQAKAPERPAHAAALTARYPAGDGGPQRRRAPPAIRATFGLRITAQP